ncbi:cytochrome p450 [Colletotrichum incanum]|uniref:Cytochrome p450 n=1 Tax=Colletotrichum incanum TaxID=1573173 RepID=A0A166QRJ7_COLIC|nr:cytochrome p450 [Colletotrichum incanum]OHW89529.1 benzoate 4-monooxygenase cytochrome [Colletotrichum incanum]
MDSTLLAQLSANATIGMTVVTAILAILFVPPAIRLATNPLRKVPGPWYADWTSLVLTYQTLRGRCPDYVQSLHEKHGPVVRIAPDYVAISDVPSAKQIHSVKTGYLKAPWYRKLGQEIVTVFNTTDPALHRRYRALLSPGLTDTALKPMAPIVEHRVRQTIEQMGIEMKNRGAVDVFKWWYFMATDIIGELTFGESFHMLDLGRKNQYIEDLEKIGRTGVVSTTFPFLLSLSRIVSIPIIRDTAETRRRITTYADRYIERYKDSLRKKHDDPKPTLFTRLFNAGQEGLPDRQIRDEAVGYITAGSGNTSNSLTFLTWAVCRNESVREHLVEELSSLPRDFEEHDLSRLPFLNQVIDESLRMYPAAPSLLPRVVPSAGVTLGGHWIPGGTTVGTQAWTMHRKPEIFPRPEVFHPERWNQPTKAMKDAFMPFGGGSRVCIGLRLARMEMRLAVAHFFRAFPNAVVSKKEGMSDQDMRPQQFFLLQPEGGRCLIDAS